MADLDIAIAGRSYRVACADGEEENLTEAARLVATEAESLREQFGTRFAALTETRMLLMASLMLGDRFRAHLAEEAAAFAEAPEFEPSPAEAAAPQSGFFDDPAQSARIDELEAALAAAQQSERAALAALEEAAERIRALAGEIAEDGLVEEEEEDAPLGDLEDAPLFEDSDEAEPLAEAEDAPSALDENLPEDDPASIEDVDPAGAFDDDPVPPEETAPEAPDSLVPTETPWPEADPDLSDPDFPESDAPEPELPDSDIPGDHDPLAPRG